MRPRPLHILAVSLSVALTTPAAAQTALAGVDTADADPTAPREVDRPASARRIVRVFDFEHPALASGDVPPDWVRAQDAEGVRDRTGFPHWNEAYLDRETVYRGAAAIRIPTYGRNTSLRLLPGVLPVFPNGDYLITARVRTDALRHARARVVARFLDASGNPIPGSDVASDPIESPDRWTLVRVHLMGEFDHAADIQIDLELVQPRIYDDPRLGDHNLWREDFDAAASFDDVAVFQLPRVEFATASPANVILAHETPTLELAVRDLTGESLEATITLRDDHDRVIDTWADDLGRGRVRRRWNPDLPAFGWYRAELRIINGGAIVGGSVLDFAYLPGDSPALDAGDTTPDEFADRQRLVLMLDHAKPYLLTAVPELLQRTAVRAITLPVWNADTQSKDATAEAARLGPFADALAARGVRFDFALPRVPTDLRLELGLEPFEIASALAAPVEIWGPFTDAFLDRFGQLSSTWRLGGGHHPDHLPILPERMGEQLPIVRAGLKRLVPGPRLHLAWPAEVALPEDADITALSGLSLRLPAGIEPAAAEHILDRFRPNETDPARGVSTPSAPALNIDLVYTPLRDEALTPYDAAAHLAHTALHFWRALPRAPPTDDINQARRFVLAAPWSEQLARAFADRLSGRRFEAELSPAPGIHAWLFTPAGDDPEARGSVIVAWSDATVDPATGAAPILELLLGPEEVHAFDLFGNHAIVDPVTLDPTPQPRRVHRVPLSDAPLYIENVDADLFRVAASVAVRPGFFPVVNYAHNAELVLENPFPTTLVGRWTIVSPGARPEADTSTRARTWNIDPRAGALSIPPGGRTVIPLRLAFSLLERARELPVVVEIASPAGILRVAAPIEIGVPDVSLRLAYRPAPTPEGPHLVVDALVINHGDAPISLQGAAYAPGVPRQGAIVPTLPPKREIVRRFVFRNIYQQAKGREAVVSLTTTEGERLNAAIRIEP